MKKLLALILALVMCFALVACGSDDEAKTDDDDDNDIVDIGGNDNDDDDDDEEDELLGKWVHEESDEEYFIFKSNGRLVVGGDGEEATGEYEYDGDEIVLTVEGDDLVCEIEIKGSKMTLTAENGVEIVLYKDGKKPSGNNNTSANNNAVAEWVEENEDDMLAAMEQSFAGSSGMTCTSSIKVSGNGFTINININELTNVTADQKKQLQDTYDAMDGQFEALLDNAQRELPELEYINYNVCDKYGNVLAVIRTGD